MISNIMDNTESNIMSEDSMSDHHISGLTLRAVKKLTHFNCTIGTEGTVDGWLCDNLDVNAPDKYKTCVLLIFIARDEELVMRAVTTVPTSKELTALMLEKVLEGFRERYVAISIQERNQCAHLN